MSNNQNAPEEEEADGKDKNVYSMTEFDGQSWRRMNAWGSLSYAELIAKAIHSSREGQMTLGEIYAWLVDNVDYFRQRSDDESSVGWKV